MPPPITPPRRQGTPKALGTAVHGPPPAWIGQTSAATFHSRSVCSAACTAGSLAGVWEWLKAA